MDCKCVIRIAGNSLGRLKQTPEGARCDVGVCRYAAHDVVDEGKPAIFKNWLKINGDFDMLQSRQKDLQESCARVHLVQDQEFRSVPLVIDVQLSWPTTCHGASLPCRRP